MDEEEARRAVSPRRPGRGGDRGGDRGGYRTSKRTSKAGKAARREAASERRRERIRAAGRRLGAWSRRVVTGVGVLTGVAAALVVVLLVVALGINAFARWSAQREAEEGRPAEASEEVLRDLVVIAEGDAGAAGFLALRTDPEGGRVYAIAIPEGAFMEVPGQGFDRVAASYPLGASKSVTTLSNFLSVPFRHYVVVPEEAYSEALRTQDLEGLLGTVIDTDLSPGDVGRFSEWFAEAETDDVAVVPLPVNPITLGEQTYFEPQREEIADIVYSWWGVRIGGSSERMELIVYNGSGVPGIAGVAAQELIEEGFRVVETGNADTFDHERTLVYVYSGRPADARRIVETLGVGDLRDQEGSQEVADAIVVIGADYAAPSPE